MDVQVQISDIYCFLHAPRRFCQHLSFVRCHSAPKREIGSGTGGSRRTGAAMLVVLWAKLRQVPGVFFFSFSHFLRVSFYPRRRFWYFLIILYGLCLPSYLAIYHAQAILFRTLHSPCLSHHVCPRIFSHLHTLPSYPDAESAQFMIIRPIFCDKFFITGYGIRGQST